MVNYPASLDSLTNPTASDLTTSVTVPHATEHANANDILEALEAKLGIGSSTPPASGAVLRRTGTGASAWGALVNADVDAAAAIVYSKLSLTNSLVTGDLVANAATQAGAASISTSSPTTTSTTAVDLTEMSVTLTTVGGPLLVIASTPIACTLVRNTFTYVKLDSDTAIQKTQVAVPTANFDVAHAWSHLFTGVSAASHTVKVQWSVAEGTATSQGTMRSLTVVELKR
jgi:hypothetical protein